MPKKSFLSFDYERDNWRVSQIKNIGAIEEQPLLDGNKWEEIKKKGDQAIKNWIDSNMRGRDCLVVLVGTRTSGRRWVQYEIGRAWELNMGVCGIYIHSLKDREGKQSTKGTDPFQGFKVNGLNIAPYAKMYEPPMYDSSAAYQYIAASISGWIDLAVVLRSMVRP